MSALTNVEVIIDGRIYTLSGYEGQDYLQKVATYINGKINELEAASSFKHLSNDLRSIFIQLNIADDYFKAKNQAEKLEQDLKIKEREIYDLKHELISSQMKCDSADERVRELEAENRELLLTNTRLETTLEDALLENANMKSENVNSSKKNHKSKK